MTENRAAELRETVALIVGFDIHGLAIARSLFRAGIEVHALTPHRTLATTCTRYAHVHHQPEINVNGIAEKLAAFATSHLKNREAVLFPTNDNMVRAIGAEWSLLKDHYRLSWVGCRDLVLKLQIKDNLPYYCQRANVLHPVSTTVRSAEDCQSLKDIAGSRLVVKPIRPLSSFKAVVIHSVSELEKLIMTYPHDLPFIVQRYIEGADDALYFCAMYLADSREICAVTGQKLRSTPAGTGQGTIMTIVNNNEVLTLSRNFVKGMNLSGPVAIEYKRDPDGNYWLIEPNVGRTEYCVDLLIQSGINMPLFEYLHASSNSVPSAVTNQPKGSTWYDTERDPWSFISHVVATRRIFPLGRKPIFPFLGHVDRKPFFKSLEIRTVNLISRTVKKTVKESVRLAASGMAGLVVLYNAARSTKP